MQHALYFIGGPFDLTKRMYPGRCPAGAVIELPVVPDHVKVYGLNDLVPPPDGPIIEVTSLLYRVRYGSEAFGENGSFYIAVYDGIR